MFNNPGKKLCLYVSLSSPDYEVSPEEMKILLEPFFHLRTADQQRSHGTGLGFALASEILALHENGGLKLLRRDADHPQEVLAFFNVRVRSTSPRAGSSSRSSQDVNVLRPSSSMFDSGIKSISAGENLSSKSLSSLPASTPASPSMRSVPSMEVVEGDRYVLGKPLKILIVDGTCLAYEPCDDTTISSVLINELIVHRCAQQQQDAVRAAHSSWQ